MAPRRNATFTKSFVRTPGGRGGEDASIPIQTEAPPPLRQPTKIARAKTLTRPERHQPQVPLINPEGTGVGRTTSRRGRAVWKGFSRCVTCWAPGFCLSGCGGLKDASSQQAWREKIALVFLALLLGGFVGFITMGMNKLLCPQSAQDSPDSLVRIGHDDSATVGINGFEYNITSAKLPDASQVGYNMYTRAGKESGYDITPLFQRDQATFFPECQGKTGLYATTDPCTPAAGLKPCPLGELSNENLDKNATYNTERKVGYAWDDLASGKYNNFIVIDGNVLNMEPYMNANPSAVSTDEVDVAIRTALSLDLVGGHDATRIFYMRPAVKDAVKCMEQKYFAGHIDKVTPGCFVSNLFLYISLVIILGLVLIRFLMAIYFSWFLSSRMSAPPRDLDYGTGRGDYNLMPEGAMATVSHGGAAPWANKERPPPLNAPKRIDSGNVSSTQAAIGNEPYVVCLVTCYSEGEEGISNTLTSLAGTDYPDSKKLLFVVADGMVTGSGESQSTPDICVGLLDADPRFGTPMPMSFISVAQGKKQQNMAMVYAGHYTRSKGHRTPMIIVVKCGTPEEATGAKPGNRGKRDGQMILMNFLQRVTYNDRMTPLDFDLFRKFHALMGVTPDFFELCMMVDADTKVYPKSMRMLCNSMMRDHLIMGACGETRIANKRASWVTAIQVYEYFISHHMVKAFESVFGGVTCLPGCFSMYRIKARKPADEDWVPVIVKPEVTREYSQSTVTTLHQKNLLLLGEDRFLTTLLLRTFPNRKMVFVPQARCRTEVPHTFKMLLSQRRRWINSTVHNLMELVLVRDLCGTFCFSMQFVVFMDLIGTAVLPIAIALTYTLVATYIVNPPQSFTEAIPLMLLIAVLGLPAVLILLSTGKVVYTMWMIVYLIFLPVWNFILPVYSFWHFDDFSWGETRKVEGEIKQMGHGDSEGVFAAASVPLRRWEDWERSRLKRQIREERRRREMEKQFGGGFYNDMKGVPPPVSKPHLPPHMQPRRDSDQFSDMASSEGGEDMWGPHIGAFNEEAPPPLAISRHSIWVEGQEVIVQQDMEKMLSQGWAEDEDGLNKVGLPLGPSATMARRSQRFSRFNMPDVPPLPNEYSHNPAPPQQPQPPNLYSNGRNFSNSGLRSPLSPGALVDRTPSPAHGEDVILLRGGPPSPFDTSPFASHDNLTNSSFSFDRERGSSTAVGVGPQSHARNRSSGTHHFSNHSGGPRSSGGGSGSRVF